MRSLADEVRRVGGTALGWAAWLALMLVWGLVVVPLTRLLALRWPGLSTRYARLTHHALRAYVLHLPFVRFVVDGTQQRLGGPRILVVNHQSRLDSPLLLALEPGVFGPVRSYMLRVPLVGSAIRLLGFFDADADFATFDAMNRAAAHARANGGALIFYPEGTRSTTGEIGRFHRGAFRAAVDHHLPIQPVVIEGLDAVLPPGRAIPPVYGRYPVRVRYLAPLHPPFGAGPRREVVRALTERVREQMLAELAELRAERAERAPVPARRRIAR